MPTASSSPIIIVEGHVATPTAGEILKEEFLDPMGVTSYRLAKSIGVPQSYISKVLHGGNMSPDLSVLLDR